MVPWEVISLHLFQREHSKERKIHQISTVLLWEKQLQEEGLFYLF